MDQTWNLDDGTDYTKDKREAFLKEHGYDKGTHDLYSVGDTIHFMTGYNNDILASAKIKGIDGENLYVYNDCYWFPVTSDRVLRLVS